MGRMVLRALAVHFLPRPIMLQLDKSAQQQLPRLASGGPGCFWGVGWHPPPLPLPSPSATAVQEHGAAQPLVELSAVRPGEHEVLQVNKEHSFLSKELGRQGLPHLCTKSHAARQVHARGPVPLGPTLVLGAADRSRPHLPPPGCR